MTDLLSAPSTDGTDHLTVPPWVGELFGPRPAIHKPVTTGSITQSLIESPDWLLLSLRAAHVGQFDAADFQHVSQEIYLRLHDALSRHIARYPVRLWNFIPHIHLPQGAGMDRYMVFNAGRYAAYASWYGDFYSAERSIPTASGVGHDGEDLILHALASTHPGNPVENPRQVSAYHYSKRYGPRPPCFSRATVITQPHHRPRILIGGTASVVGEDSRHEEDITAQAHETFTNLAELIRAADGTENTVSLHHDAPSRLKRFTDLRVYHVRPGDLATLKVLVRENFPGVQRIEWVRSDLCRPELLVEIEGVAETAMP